MESECNSIDWRACRNNKTETVKTFILLQVVIWL